MTLTVLWVAPALLFLFGFHSDWHATWSAVGVPAERVSFADLRGITGGLATLRENGDPLVVNPGDRWNRPMNYPRVWLTLFSVLGINNNSVSFVGVALCALYLLCISALLIRCRHAVDVLILLMAGLSLAPLYGIELGNTDLLIFSLVFLGCITRSNGTRSGALFAATILKIYPLVTIPIDIPWRPRKERIAFALLTAVAIGWFAWQWRDFAAIRRATPVASDMAYGVLSIKTQVEHEAGILPGRTPVGGWIVVLACWLVGAGITLSVWKSCSVFEESIRHSTEGRLFSAFGAIYAFSFALGSNWDYRLIFLLPTLPMALDLIRHRQHRKWAIAYIVLVLLAENPLDLRSIYGTALSHLTTFLIFLFVVATLALQYKPASEAAPTHGPEMVPV